MRALIITLTALSACAPAIAADAPSRADLHQTSWGKPGVGFEQYRTDAIECGIEASSYDLTKAPVGQKLLAFNKAQEIARRDGWMMSRSAWGGLGDAYLAVNSSPWASHFFDTEYLEARDLQYQLLGECLSNRGYRQFRLTAHQMKTLDGMRRGSDARNAYMHSLASDPTIMAHQGLTTL